MSGIIGMAGQKSGIIRSGLWVASAQAQCDGICDIGKLRLMRFSGTSGGSASDHGASAVQNRYYIQIAITFGYTFSAEPMCIWHWEGFDNHQATIASTNTSTTNATAYTHAATASSIQSRNFTVLVVGEN